MNLLDLLRRRKKHNNTPRQISVSTRLPSLHSPSHRHKSTLDYSPSKSMASHKSFIKQGKWEELPPIYQLRRSRILDLDQRKSEVIENLLLSKHEAGDHSHSHRHRNKTETTAHRKKYILSHRQSAPMNFQEVRMKPIDKYQKRLDNIRLAQRLLTAKPSLGLDRHSLKKFYLQQRNYKSQLSRNCDKLRKKTKKRSKLLKEWLF